MEKLVLCLCGIWFWLTRKYRAIEYRKAASWLTSAHDALAEDLYSRWSTRDRGYILPFQAEALSILKRHSTLTIETANRFDSLLECCRFVAEELTGVRSNPVELPRVAPASKPVLAPAGTSFRFFWNPVGSGTASRPFPVLPLELKPALLEAEVPRRRAA